MCRVARTEPDLVVEPALLPVLAELREREPIFHRPELGMTGEDLERQVAPEFWEVGASGRRYSREYVLTVVRARSTTQQVDPWETDDFHCRQLGPEVFLLTYTLRQRERVTRRVSVWRRGPQGWQVVFHQGTLVSE